jgi:hypothetical protein
MKWRLGPSFRRAKPAEKAYDLQGFTKWRGPESNRRHHDFQGPAISPARRIKALQIPTSVVGRVEAGYAWILADIGGFWT